MDSRLNFIEAGSSHLATSLGEAVRAGFAETPKRLPCRFFYDHAGSDLFEEITRLPEYYLTRCDTEILGEYAEEITGALGDRIALIELGSGSSTKTRLLIEAALRRQGDLHYVPVDISKSFLKCSAEKLLEAYPELTVTALAGEYESALCRLPASDEPRLILLLGSNIGNFSSCEATAFLQKVSACMDSRDGLLVGVDLVKERQVLHDAYNDSAGVTARFNRNLLARINAELGADFDLGSFDHNAPFDEAAARIEMRLVSNKDQVVTIAGIGQCYEFEDGEYILTEWSHKYSSQSVSMLAETAGLKVEREWTDRRNWFAEFLLKKT
jgi:L-histidine Nalpha-methyltransferase